MKIRIMAAGLAASALMASSALASTNLLTNGGFEDIGAAAPQGWGGYTYGSGYTPVLPGWTIDSGTVDITQTGSEWGPAFEGTNSLDLNGWNPGEISQTFATTPGKTYVVSFAYSRNAAGAPDPATATVSAGGQTLNVSAPLGQFGGPSNMTWKTASFDFVANSASSTLSLTATNPGNGGVFFDAVSVVDPPSVPEPATWAMMLLGLGGMGAVLRRNRRPVAAAATA